MIVSRPIYIILVIVGLIGYSVTLNQISYTIYAINTIGHPISVVINDRIAYKYIVYHFASTALSSIQQFTILTIPKITETVK